MAHSFNKHLQLPRSLDRLQNHKCITAVNAGYGRNILPIKVNVSIIMNVTKFQSSGYTRHESSSVHSKTLVLKVFFQIRRIGFSFLSNVGLIPNTSHTIKSNICNLLPRNWCWYIYQWFLIKSLEFLSVVVIKRFGIAILRNW